MLNKIIYLLLQTYSPIYVPHLYIYLTLISLAHFLFPSVLRMHYSNRASGILAKLSNKQITNTHSPPPPPVFAFLLPSLFLTLYLVILLNFFLMFYLFILPSLFLKFIFSICPLVSIRFQSVFSFLMFMFMFICSFCLLFW